MRSAAISSHPPALQWAAPWETESWAWCVHPPDLRAQQIPCQMPPWSSQGTESKAIRCPLGWPTLPVCWDGLDFSTKCSIFREPRPGRTDYVILQGLMQNESPGPSFRMSEEFQDCDHRALTEMWSPSECWTLHTSQAREAGPAHSQTMTAGYRFQMQSPDQEM